MAARRDLDNYLVFAEQHGARRRSPRDPALRAAYERRRHIADNFLAMVREAYAKRRRRPPFDDRTKLETVLHSAGRRSRRERKTRTVAVHAIMPAPAPSGNGRGCEVPTAKGRPSTRELPLHWGPRENIVWKTDIPGRGNSSPVIWDERIFITAASDDGKERKIRVLRAAATAGCCGKHAAPHSAARETLYTKNTFASSTPVTDGQRVIAFFGNGGLVVRRHRRASAMARRPRAFSHHARSWHEPRALQGRGDLHPVSKPRQKPVCRLRQADRGQTLAAGHARTRRRWSTPVVVRIGDRDQLVYNGSNYIAGYEPETGKELWRVTGTSHEAIPTVVVGGGLLYFGLGPQRSDDGHPAGRTRRRHGDERRLAEPARRPARPFAPVSRGPRLYRERHGDRDVHRRGRRRTVWQHRLRGRFSMSPIEAEGRILVTSEEGRSTIFQAGDTFQVLAENDLDEPVLATPALLGGRLYFRTASHLWCVGSAAAK